MRVAAPSCVTTFDRDHLWHPYTSLSDPLPVVEVRSAAGVRLTLADGRELIDGMSSWWAVIHGYHHPLLNAALHRQVESMAHVMFGGITHRPAVELAQRLLAMTPAALSNVFFCDSGSVAVEVAMKMALQYWQALDRPERVRFLTVRGGYHGDTFHAMSVCDPVTGMHGLFRATLPRNVFAERPGCRFDGQWDARCLRDLEQRIEAHRGELAAVILEPIVQGAGGMHFYHPEYLRAVRELCTQHDILLVADEIATGFGRTGKLFACEHAQVTPDILCLGKALTGGYLSLAATLATDRVAQGVCRKGAVFMHGPTFMGNPLACAVACASLDLLDTGAWRDDVRRIESGLRRGLQPCAAYEAVADVRALGAIGVVEMKQPVSVADLQHRLVERGVWVRPFGNLVYLMPPYVIGDRDLAALTAAIVDVLGP